MNYITKAILLISSQSPAGKFLPGVTADSQTMKRHFLSPNGGAFLPSEIHTLTNPTCQQVITYLEKLKVDYLYIHISAHGYTTTDNRRMICFYDGDLCDLQLLNASKWQTLSVDGCRNVNEPGAIGSIRGFEEKYLNFTGSWARAYFDRCLQGLPPGKLIVWGTLHGMYSYELPNAIGGRFTVSCLEAIEWYQRSCRSEGYLTFDYLLPSINKLLSTYFTPQQAQIVYRTPGFSPPIAIVSPNLIKMVPDLQPSIQPTSSNHGNIVGVVALALLTAALLSD